MEEVWEISDAGGMGEGGRMWQGEEKGKSELKTIHQHACFDLSFLLPRYTDEWNEKSHKTLLSSSR